jgi:uncharacterized membrane protein
MKRVLLLLVLFSLAFPIQVYGDIYEAGTLERLNSVVLTVSADHYSYRQVFSSSNYSIDLPDGSYDIKVEHYSDGVLTHEFNESVNLNGQKARMDFVLEPLPSQVDLRFYAIAGVLIILLLIIIHRILLIHFPAKKPPLINTSEEVQEKTIELDNEAKKVLDIIESNEGRMTQKELKEILNYSDSKMSLIIAELEHFGLIKKFKRGRGNIIKKIEKKK